MDKVILGFLMIKELSQYDILRALQNEVSPFYQASLGSIQNALKKLEQSGAIEVQRILVGGRKKNLYKITTQGKLLFVEWMEDEIIDSKLEAELSTRLFFMGHLEPNNRVKIIRRYIKRMEEIITTMKSAEQSYRKRTFDERVAQIVEYQFETLDLGITQYESVYHWLQELLKKEEV